MQLETLYDEYLEDGGTSQQAWTATRSLPASGFVTGKKYLLLVRAEVGTYTGSAPPALYTSGHRVVHGSTAFPGSEARVTNYTSANDHTCYVWFTVWTAVAGEAVTLETRMFTSGASSRYGFPSLTAIRLSDALTENTHWRFAEDAADHTLTTSFVDGATLTWTPAQGGDTWLVLSHALLTMDTGSPEVDAAADGYVSRLDKSGEASGGWEALVGGRNVSDQWTVPGCWVGTLGAVSQTFKEQAKRVGTTAATAQRLHSTLFALNLSRFDAHVVSATDAQSNFTATQTYQEMAAVQHQQAVDQGKVLVLGYCQMSPVTDAGWRNIRARVRRDTYDAFDTDPPSDFYSRFSGTTTERGGPFTPGWQNMFYYPADGGSEPNQTYPYLHVSLETLTAGLSEFALQASGPSTAIGAKTRRLIALSLDVPALTPPTGTAVADYERNEQIMYLHDPIAARRRIMVRCVLAATPTDPATAEANGQPYISRNGAAFTTTGVGVLVAVDSANGLYYCELTAAALSEMGSLRLRYSSATAALFTVTLAVELLPVLWSGDASAGGANTVTLSSPLPSYVQPGTIVRVTDGTGAGQSMLATAYEAGSGLVTVEANWTTPPGSGSHVVLEPGLPFVVPDVNVAQIGGSATAASNLSHGAGALQVGAVVTGANSAIQVVCDLPVTVGGNPTPPNFYKDRAIIFRTGALAGDEALITGSVVSGSNTILAVDILTGTPTVGDTFVVT